MRDGMLEVKKLVIGMLVILSLVVASEYVNMSLSKCELAQISVVGGCDKYGYCGVEGHTKEGLTVVGKTKFPVLNHYYTVCSF